MIRRLKNIFVQWKLSKVLVNVNKGKLCEIALNTKFIFPENVTIGDYVYLGPGGMINAMGKVHIGTGTIVGPNILILTGNHNFNSDRFVPYDETHILKEVRIDVGVWIGANVIITPGSHVGKGVIIGAGSVVSGIIPDYSIVVGNPARVVKERDRVQFDKLVSEEAFYLKNKKNGSIKPNFDGI